MSRSIQHATGPRPGEPAEPAPRDGAPTGARARLGGLIRPLTLPQLVVDLALAAVFADRVRRFVRFAAEHPELNRIITHEATSRTERLQWMTERHVSVYADAMRTLWDRLREAGVAAPIDGRLIHHVLVGAASLVFVNSPEFELLHGEAPDSDEWITRHADGLVAMLLPGFVPPAT